MLAGDAAQADWWQRKPNGTPDLASAAHVGGMPSLETIVG